MNDDVLDLLIEFEDLFEPGEEHPDAELLDELLDDLATAAGETDEVGEDLVESLGELAVAGRTSEAERCARYLTDLAGRLAGRPRTRLLTGVDLVLGGLAAEQERWEEAGTRAARARAAIGPDLFGDQVAHCELVLGGVAAHRGDVAAATRHWEAALAGFTADGRWPEAASAAGSLAELAEDTEGGGESVQRLWRQTADLMFAAGDTGKALECATYACRLTLAELRETPDAADTAAGFAKAEEARAFAVRHGVGPVGVELLTTTAILGADRGLPWEQVAGWFAQTRRECRDVGPDAERIELYLAGIDFAEGSAAVGRNLPVQAEGPLRAALPVFRKYGRAVEEQACVRLLTGLLGFFEPDATRAEQVATGRMWTDPESKAGALTVKAARALRDGCASEAEALLEQAKGLAAEAGRDEKALALEVLGAARQLEQGDEDSARRCLERIDHYLAIVGPSLYRGAVRSLEMLAGLLRAGLAQRSGGRAGAAELERVEAQMLEAGAGLLAAQVAVGRGRCLLELSQSEEATRVLVPAVLALDAVRFTLDDAGRRERWSAAVTEAYDAAFRAAAASDDPRLLAELIEVARANAVPTPRPDGAAGSAFDELVAETQRDGLPQDPPPGALGTLSGAAALAGDEGRTALGLPAYLRTPWDTIALAEHLALAHRYHAPVRADVAVDWRIREDEPWTVRGGLSR